MVRFSRSPDLITLLWVVSEDASVLVSCAPAVRHLRRAGEVQRQGCEPRVQAVLAQSRFTVPVSSFVVLQTMIGYLIGCATRLVARR